MRALKRNMREFYYASYLGKNPLEDEFGNLTGEYEISYSDPVKVLGNISASRGETETRQFGENEVYDKVIVLDLLGPQIDEYSVLWVDVVPDVENSEVTIPYDYVVKKVARSLNSISIAIAKVNISV